MGEYTTFVCRECGYTADNIRWGVSVNDPRKRFMPAVCVECKAIAEVDLTGADILVDEFHCLTCGSQLFFLEKATRTPAPSARPRTCSSSRASTGEALSLSRRRRDAGGAPSGRPARVVCALAYDDHRAAGRHPGAHLEHVGVVHADAAVTDGLADQRVLVCAVDGHRAALRPVRQPRLERAEAQGEDAVGTAGTSAAGASG